MLLDVYLIKTIRKTKANTIYQSENPEWVNHCKGRTTVSNISSILSFKFTENHVNFVLKRVMGSLSVIGAPSLKLGKEN